MSKGKFLIEAYKSYDSNKVYNFNDAVDIILNNKRSKINETIEISLNLLKNFSQSWPKHEKPEKWIVKNKNSITEKINYKFKK